MPLSCVSLYLCIFSPHPQNEEDSGEDSEEDDGFFVPHGYLSEGEGEHSDGEVATATDNVSLYSCISSNPHCNYSITHTAFKLQWNLAYSNFKYPAAQIIWPQSLHILFNAHSAHRAK